MTTATTHDARVDAIKRARQLEAQADAVANWTEAKALRQEARDVLARVGIIQAN